MSKIDKHLIDLVLSKIIMNYGGRTSFTKAFAIVEQCNHALCQFDASDLVSLLVASSKFRKVPVAVTGLAEAKLDKTLYCLSYGQVGHAKKDCPSKQRQAQSIGNPKRKPIVPAKDSTKGAGYHLPQQFKYYRCGQNNHAVDNCLALHPEIRPSFEREKPWRQILNLGGKV